MQDKGNGKLGPGRRGRHFFSINPPERTPNRPLPATNRRNARSGAQTGQFGTANGAFGPVT